MILIQSNLTGVNKRVFFYSVMDRDRQSYFVRRWYVLPTSSLQSNWLSSDRLSHIACVTHMRTTKQPVR